MSRYESLLLLTLLTVTASLGGNCYILQNNSKTVQTWRFRYDPYAPPYNAPIVMQMSPNGRYPVQNEWCWDLPDGYYAYVSIDILSETLSPLPGFTPSWQGALVLGNGILAAPAGTYTLNPPTPPPPDPHPNPPN